MSTPGQRLRLASHVRACHSDDQVILLDLRRNLYLGVGGPHLAALATAIDGWPSSCQAAVHVPVSAAEIAALAKPLIAQGLLTDQPVDHEPKEVIGEATTSLNALDAVAHPTLGTRRFLRVLRSAASAALWLRCRSLLVTTQAVAARRARLGDDASRPPAPATVSNAVAAYERLRSLVYSAHGRCLHDSLALVGFLAQEGILARWVIGVQTRPFAAHSWVQSGGLVLNDQHEHVRRFSPIVVV
ncbi:hypothetical protein BH11PSE8_BH11PSE8_32910 [soil metagenome]